MKRCEEIMTADPAFCREADRVREAAEIMRDRNVGALPVLRGDRLVGLLTDRDITVRVVAAGLDCAETPVEKAMTRDPTACRPDDRLDRVVEMMEKDRVRRIPVVNADGWMVGIVTPSDVATRAREPMMVAYLVEEISRPPAIPA